MRALSSLTCQKPGFFRYLNNNNNNNNVVLVVIQYLLISVTENVPNIISYRLKLIYSLNCRTTLV
jgi:hypothetical protein